MDWETKDEAFCKKKKKKSIKNITAVVDRVFFLYIKKADDGF